MQLNRLILATVSLLFVSAAHAQITAGSISTPLSGAFGGGVTVTSSGAGLGLLQGAPFALPVFGVPKIIQFTALNDLFQFNNLPVSGSGSVGGLTTTMNFTVNPGVVPIGPLNFLTSYAYNADVIVNGNPGTRVSFTPTGAPTFVFGGSTYQVDLNSVEISGEGAPTSLSTNTVTGSITNLTAAAAPEPTTLALAGLGLVGLIARRRQRGA